MFVFFYIIILATENGERHGRYYFFGEKIFLNKSLDVKSVGIVKYEVDEFLDDVIKDYETYATLVKSLRQEIADLKEELARKPKPSPVQTEPFEAATTSSMTNFDILKRLNRLEKEVFGKQILDNSGFLRAYLKSAIFG